MSYNIETVPNFEREAKKLIKKYKSLKRELKELITELEQNPTLGTDLGNQVFKIRLKIASKGKGKSGGARVITYVKMVNNLVFLIAIYDKSEKDIMSSYQIQHIIDNIDVE